MLLVDVDGWDWESWVWESCAVRVPIEEASPPFADRVTAKFVDRHYEVVTRQLVEGRWPVPVKVGREGNFTARDHNNRGQLAPGDDRFTALCVAHSYGVMHYSETLSFVRSCPELTSVGAIAAVDIGCGIGSGLAALHAATGDGDHRWLGFDPHRATLALAEAVLDGIVLPSPVFTAELDSATAARLTGWAAEGRRTVLVASHVLGQRTVTDESLERMARWVVDVVANVGSAELIGIEPDRSGVVERGPEMLGLLGRSVSLACQVDEVRELTRLETRSTAPIAPFVGPGRKRVRWYTLLSG